MDLQNGIGTYIWKDGSKYSGHWINGNPHGLGTWENLEVKYVGQWIDGHREGKGKLTRKVDQKNPF